MNTESRFKRWVTQNLLPDAHFQCIENTTGSGVPDINVCWRGQEFWIETKSIGAGDLLLRPFQLAWMMRRWESGGHVFLFAEGCNYELMAWHVDDRIRTDFRSRYHAVVSVCDIALLERRNSHARIEEFLMKFLVYNRLIPK